MFDADHRLETSRLTVDDHSGNCTTTNKTAEAQRLQALHDLCILDTAPDWRIDRIVELAANLFSVPIALVSLVDANRQWFKAKTGTDVVATPRCEAFCDWTIRQPQVLVVPDALADPRFEQNHLVVGAPHIRFYAGAPLIVGGGHRVGSLCVIDRTPRADAEPKTIVRLMRLARLVVGEFELCRREAETRRLSRVQDQLFQSVAAAAS